MSHSLGHRLFSGPKISQLFPPPPTFTEEDLADLSSRVFIVTGGTDGVGRELVKMLYSKNASVYILARNQEKGNNTVQDIKAESSDSKGRVQFLKVDFSDLTTIKPCVESFLALESTLDVLWLNAGISLPPVGSKSPQGHELTIATNCLGPFLLNKLLEPLLLKTAAVAAAALETNKDKTLVRVIWASSMIWELRAEPSGIKTSDLSPQSSDEIKNYILSKIGVYFLSSESDKRLRTTTDSSLHQLPPITHLTVNPGQLWSKIWKASAFYIQFFAWLTGYHPRFGAYSELWAGLSEEVTRSDGGRYVVPWGRWREGTLRPDLELALKGEEEGGTGEAEGFWRWCEERTSGFT